MTFTRPDKIKLTPQQRRVFDALRNGWCNEQTIRQKAARPGHEFSCDAKVLVSMVKRAIARHGWAVETRPIDRQPDAPRNGKPPVAYRIVPAQQVRAAA